MAAMEQVDAFIGFPPLPDQDLLVEALLADPPERRWRVVRELRDGETGFEQFDRVISGLALADLAAFDGDRGTKPGEG